MTLSGRNRECTSVSWDGEMDRKVFGPNTEILGSHTRAVIGRISENAEDTGGKEACDGHGHPGKPLHEEIDRILAIEFKRGTSSFSRISPWVIMIQPIPKSDSAEVI